MEIVKKRQFENGIIDIIYLPNKLAPPKSWHTFHACMPYSYHYTKLKTDQNLDKQQKTSFKNIF